MSKLNKSRRVSIPSVLASASLFALGLPCAAQAETDDVAEPAPPTARQSANYASTREIIVTARKREESVMRTPVVMQAVTAAQIQDLKIDDMYALSTVAPGINITAGFSTVGAVVSLRGLGNGLGANFIDQSVLLNIDGAPLPHGSFYRTGLFDVGQIEVLKGPQALFYGKSSSAGIIAIHSADPTPEWESRISAGYEFKGDEKTFDGYISGPITDTLGIRVAGYFSYLDGYFTQRNPLLPHRLPEGETYGGRITLKYDNSENLKINLKVSKSWNDDTAYNGAMGQTICRFANPQNPNTVGLDNCKFDTVLAGQPPSVGYDPDNPFPGGAASPLFKNGTPYQSTTTTFGVLTGDWEIFKGLTATSVTSFSKAEPREAGRTFLPPPVDVFDIAAALTFKSFSQELRLTSDWDSPINFLLGGFISRDSANTHLVIGLPGLPLAFGGPFYTDNSIKIKTHTESAFAQLLLTPIENWELSLGGRYTNVHKFATRLTASSSLTLENESIDLMPESQIDFSQDNFSPEATLTWRPTDELTTFLSYKRGYKGPGFNANTNSIAYYGGQPTLFGIDAATLNGQTIADYTALQISPFGGEKVRGFEGGVKAQLLDRQLQLTASAYRYKYKGIQVAFVAPQGAGSYIVKIEPNANARVQGIELGADYSPSAIEGLTLSAFVNYNDSKYTKFDTAPCYPGQTEALGCLDVDPDPVGVIPAQDLTGRRLNNAAKWTGQLGFDYRTAVGRNTLLGVSVNSNLSSKYNFVPELQPIAEQKSYVTLDGAVRFGSAEESWEVALIGRNLTNKIVATGGQTQQVVTPGVPSDPTGYATRPRQVMLQLTIRPHRM